jgi:hypothetical protein
MLGLQDVKLLYALHWSGGCDAAAPPNLQKLKFKKHDFIGIISEVYLIYPSAKISH